MRAVLFFKMVQQGREIRARERAKVMWDLCHVAFIPNASQEGFEKLRDFYWERGLSKREFEQIEKQRAHIAELTRVAVPVLDQSNSEQAQNFLDVFRSVGGAALYG